jgi:hypothetical protein
MIEIWINLSSVLGCFMWRIQIELGGGQKGGCAIALSGGHLSHVGSDLLFLIIAGRIIWIK